MKKIFQAIGIISLVIISFIYTEKTTMVVREYDEIMIKIKEQKNISKIDSVIYKDTIIPGILEKKINVNESYKNMKMKGFYNDELLIYEKIDNDNSLKNNYDKYIISGNKLKNMVSFIFVLDSTTDISELIKILDKFEIKATFVINNSWLNKNSHLLNKLNNHSIINKDEKNIKHINSVIKNIIKQKELYCYTNERNSEFLKKCKDEKNNTILSNLIDSNYLIETKKILESGSLLSYKVNPSLLENLDLIIDYIKNKGFTITNIVEHLEE